MTEEELVALSGKKMKPINLKERHTIVIFPAVPFHFNATFHKPDHFSSGDNDWQPGVRWQTMLWGGKHLGLVFKNKGAIKKPKISLSVWSTEELNDCFLEHLTQEVEYRCNLKFDLTGFYNKYGDKSKLAPLIKRWYGMRPANYRSLYEYLIIAIVLQNCNIQRSVKMLQILFETYGKLLSFDGKSLYAFWEPSVIYDVKEQELRDLKIGYRAKSIKNITSSFVKKEIDEFLLRSLHIEKQRKTLLKLYGIGSASVGYIIFDVFHNMKYLEHISPWEQKIYSKLLFDTKPDEPLPVTDILRHLENNYDEHKMISIYYFWEDIFWKRKNNKASWLEKLIKL